MASTDSPAEAPSFDAGATHKRALPSRARAPSKTTIGFTFVDQSEDLKSLADKRIVSSSQRHAIRSHVMKSVRHGENLIGKKRPTGRENSRRSSTKSAKALSLMEAELSSVTTSSNDSPRSPSTASDRSEQQLAKIPPDPSSRFDPFYTLPGNDGPSYGLIETLVKYCFETFLPMTFPVERESENRVGSRRAIILRSKIGNPGSFFGMMAIVAAHRAITSGRHHDLKPSNYDHGLLLFDDEYAIMKDYAIRATRTKTIEKKAVDDESMEATFSLIGAATIIGNFQEARIYLEGIRKNLNGSRALDPALPAVAFIPVSDIKAAVGMLSRPLFDYPWRNEEELQILMSKTTPKPMTPMSNMGSAFYKMNTANGLNWDLSTQIMEVLRIGVVVCWFGQTAADSPRLLDGSDHEIFRRKTIEMEHGLLSYIYDDADIQSIIPPPIEHIIRLTVLGMASSFITQALPSAGLGRALTHHHLHAHQSYLQTLPFSTAPTLLEKKCSVWAMFQYVHGSAGQPEEPYFINVLAELLSDLGIVSWEQVEEVLYHFLYIPALQRQLWLRIWRNVESILHRKYSVGSWTSSSSS